MLAAITHGKETARSRIIPSAVIDRVPNLGCVAAYAKQAMRDKLIEHRLYITTYGEDMPEIRNWE